MPGMHTTICLACGTTLPIELACMAAVRCQDCRDDKLPLRLELLHRQRAAREATLERSA